MIFLKSDGKDLREKAELFFARNALGITNEHYFGEIIHEHTYN